MNAWLIAERSHQPTTSQCTIMQDEFDNANELIRVLENGGLKLVVRAADEKHEDTFLLGPEFLSHVKRKVKLMRKHWRDVDLFFASPL